ncbi:formate/nitrite transporter family protein [Propioniciclava coleopterorum]|uniref:Formate/nitrite transporter family protein n=1 Tax=Propioniciclava coleopterorum TaxID=2714937 RepID=A0A6G7Y5U0_9ACTN|nr:formate/nitrite transporter family protein [Propioniciclava coleopterorum]QIK72046.1 formate/nitrite transporter family protein [Propioniciclava coleopterorum]
MSTREASAAAASGFVPTVQGVLDKKMGLLEGDPVRYFVKAGLAGVLISLMVLANYHVAGLFAASGMPGGAALGKVAGAGVFGFALVFIYFLGAELATSTMMVAGVGAFTRRLSQGRFWKLLVACMLGNGLGSVVIAVLARFSTVMTGSTLDHLAHVTETKLSYLEAGWFGYADLFVRAILCNLLINLAMAVVYNGSVRSGFGKALAMWASVIVFVVMGYEHSVANAGLFLAYGMVAPIDWVAALVAVSVAFLGNTVGGAVFVGVPYAYLGTTRSH